MTISGYFIDSDCVHCLWNILSGGGGYLPMVSSKHCSALALRRNPPEKASRPRGQALDFSKTSHSNMRMSDSRRLRNVMWRTEKKGTGLEISTSEKTVKDWKDHSEFKKEELAPYHLNLKEYTQGKTNFRRHDTLEIQNFI